MAPVDKKVRKKYFNLCDPRESLMPNDARNVDVDTVTAEARGRNWVDALATRIELSKTPVCELFTGLPGSGKSTELLRLAARLQDPDDANLFPVLIDAEEVLDIFAPIDVPDILVAILYKTDAALLAADGERPEDALKEGRFTRFWGWLTNTEIDPKSIQLDASAKTGLPGVGDVSAGARVVLDMKTSPSLRRTVRDKVAAHMTTFIAEVDALMKQFNERAQKRGHAGLVIIFDSLEKLRGISTSWAEVLRSAERVFTGGAPYLQLPVHVLYTLPPAIAFRLNVSVNFLPMLKLFDREGERAAGFEAAWEIVRHRVPDKHLNAFFGASNREDRVNRIIEWSGGYPREIVRLLQNCIAEPSLDEASFTRVLSRAAEEYRRTVTDSAFTWLARVHKEKRLIIDNDGHRETVDIMLQNNVVLRYQNNDPWVDLHPAIRDMPEVIAERRRLENAGGS